MDGEMYSVECLRINGLIAVLIDNMMVLQLSLADRHRLGSA